MPYIKLTRITHSTGENINKRTRVILGRDVKKFVERKGYNTRIIVT